MRSHRYGSPATLRRCAAATVGTLLLGASSAAYAYRPFDGTDADVAREGEFELELGSAYAAQKTGPPHLVLPAMVLNLGIFPDWELVMDVKNVAPLRASAVERPDHLDDTDLLLKGVLRRGSLQDGDGVSVATEFGVLLPNVGAESGFGAAANFIFSQRWSALTLHLNLGGALTRQQTFLGSSSLIAEGPLDLAVRPVAEIGVEREQQRPTTASALFGAIWRESDALSFDVGLRAATSTEGWSTELRIGFTWGTPLLHPGGR